ncbi:BED-type domain-containing protein [Aphelenchoides fujianensis]|nr:BED-type domain-containing protein [Aphelenchoides fujianensis]
MWITVISRIAIQSALSGVRRPANSPPDVRFVRNSVNRQLVGPRRRERECGRGKSPDVVEIAVPPPSSAAAAVPVQEPVPHPAEILSRIERGGRLLRKSAAIEDEDHDIRFSLHAAQPPPTSAAFAAAPIGAPHNPASAFAAAVAQLAQNVSVGQHAAVQPSPAGLPPLVGQPNDVQQAFTAALLSNSVKQEQRDDLFSLVNSNAELFGGGWMNVNTLAGLALMQGGEGVQAEELRVVDDRAGNRNLVKKRGRSEVWNLFGQVVDKQTGTRPALRGLLCLQSAVHGHGRRHGQHDAASLFGRLQLSVFLRVSSLDTLGDAANQSSSFDSMQAINGPTSPDDAQQHSISAAREAFAQSGGFHGAGGSLGSSGYGSIQSHPSASLELITDSHRGFHRSASAGNTSSPGGLLHPSFAATAVQPPPLLHRSGSSSGLGPTLTVNAPSSPSVTPNNRSRATTPTPLQQQPPPIHVPPLQPLTTTLQLGQPYKPTPTRPTSSLQTHPPHRGYRHHTPVPPVVVTGTGHVFTNADKQLFAQAVVQFCAQDMHNYDGEGFKNLIETVLFIGRRSHGDSQVANSFDPVRNLIPDAQQLRELFMAQDNAVRQATISDLVALKDVGISLTCQHVHFGGKKFISVIANYLTEEWQLTKRTLKILECENPTPAAFVDAVRAAMDENQIANARRILLSFDSDFDDTQELPGLPENVVVIRNFARAVNNILTACFESDPDREATSSLIDLCKRVVRRLLERKLLLKEMPPALAAIRLDGQDSQPLPEDLAVGVYLMVKFVKEHLSQVLRTFDEIKELALVEEIRRTDWSKANEVELFLDAFYETVRAFAVNQEPVFNSAVTECFALLHVCSESNESVPVEELSPPTTEADEAERSEGAPSVESSSWVRTMRKAAEKRLREWVDRNLRPEHFMAAVLNPKLRNLQVICTDIERLQIYSQLREAAGLTKSRREQSAESSRDDGEPSRKRRNFLIQLEDSAMEEDELEAYLRMPLSQVSCRTCASAPMKLHTPSSRIEAEDINTLLKLRPEVYGTLQPDSQRLHRHF